jgi:hypothetical protein
VTRKIFDMAPRRNALDFDADYQPWCGCEAMYEPEHGTGLVLRYRYTCAQHGGPKEEDNGWREALQRSAERLGEQ